MDIRHYIIGFSTEDRDQFILDHQQQNTLFLTGLKNWIIERDIEGIDSFDEPSILPILSLRCTSEAADMIAKYPEVDFVQANSL